MPGTGAGWDSILYKVYIFGGILVIVAIVLLVGYLDTWGVLLLADQQKVEGRGRGEHGENRPNLVQPQHGPWHLFADAQDTAGNDSAQEEQATDQDGDRFHPAQCRHLVYLVDGRDQEDARGQSDQFMDREQDPVEGLSGPAQPDT